MKLRQKLISLVLVAVMLVGILPLYMFAKDESGAAAQSEGTTAVCVESVSVSLGSMTALNFFVKADKPDGITAKITAGDKVTEIALSDIAATEGTYKLSAYLSSVELASAVTLTFTDANGESVAIKTPTNSNGTEAYTTSVKAYADSILKDSSYSENTKNAVKALLIYGVYAEKLFLGKDSELATLLTADDIAFVNEASFGEVITGKDDGGNYIKESIKDEALNTAISAVGDTSFLGTVKLVLDSFIKIRIALNTDIAPTVTSENALFEVGKDNGGYYVDITEITARNLNTVYTLTINGTTVSISLLAVAKLVADNAATYGNDFANLAKALYTYYYYTHVYEALPYFVFEDYSETTLNLSSAATSVGSFNYSATQSGASFATDVDEDGRRFVRWTKGTKDTVLSVTNESKNFSTSASNVVSYEVSFSKDGDNDLFYSSQIVLESNYSAAGNSGVWGALTLFNIGKTGSVTAFDGTAIGDLADGKIVNVRLAINFAAGTLTYYGDHGAILYSQTFSAPEASGATSTLQWKSLIKKYMFYWRGNDNSAAPTSTIRIYGIKIAEGNAFARDKSIDFKTGGGTLPKGTSATYSSKYATALPTPTKANAEFAGWYTSPDFAPASKISKISPDSVGAVTVYAKWNTVFVNTDFSDFDADFRVDETTDPTTVNGITFFAKGKTGALFETDVDENGRTFMRWVKGTKGSSDPTLSIHSLECGSIADMDSNIISYEFAFSRDGSAPLLGIESMSLDSSKADGSTDASLQLFKWWQSDGEVRCLLNKWTLKFISANDMSITTIRLVLDFENGSFMMYGDDGSVINSGNFTLPQGTSAATALEWKELITSSFMRIYPNKNGETNAAMRIYGIKIAEGNIFEKSNGIVYGNLSGATLPEDAPKTYSSEVPTVLPTPTHATNVFEGWYTSPDFDPATKITAVPTATTGKFTVYAKWTKYFINTSFTTPVKIDDTATDTVVIDGVTYVAAGKTGTIFETGVDESGRTYLRWVKGSTDASLSVQAANGNSVAAMESNQLSYEISFAKDGDAKVFAFANVQLESSKHMDGSNVTGGLNLLKTYGDGEITNFIGASGYSGANRVGMIDSGITTVRLVIDFENETYKYYNDNGAVILQGKFPIPEKSGASTGLEWKSLINKYLLWIYPNVNAASTSAIRFYGIKIAEGNIFE